MMKHEIEIVVLPGGELETTVKGITGSACELVSRWLEKLGQVIKHEKTPDAYKSPKVPAKERSQLKRRAR